MMVMMMMITMMILSILIVTIVCKYQNQSALNISLQVNIQAFDDSHG